MIGICGLLFCGLRAVYGDPTVTLTGAGIELSAFAGPSEGSGNTDSSTINTLTYNGPGVSEAYSDDYGHASSGDQLAVSETTAPGSVVITETGSAGAVAGPGYEFGSQEYAWYSDDTPFSISIPESDPDYSFALTVNSLGSSGGTCSIILAGGSTTLADFGNQESGTVTGILSSGSTYQFECENSGTSYGAAGVGEPYGPTLGGFSYNLTIQTVPEGSSVVMLMMAGVAAVAMAAARGRMRGVKVKE